MSSVAERLRRRWFTDRIATHSTDCVDRHAECAIRLAVAELEACEMEIAGLRSEIDVRDNALIACLRDPDAVAELIAHERALLSD